MDLPGPTAGRPLVEISGLTEEAIANLRRLTRALRPIYLEDLGLATALEMLAQETGQSAGIPVAYELHGQVRRLSPAVELALYRIAQEALHNVSRHSAAAGAVLRLLFGSDSVILEIHDDGRGFRPPAAPAEFAPSGHFGLLGMHERAELIGAHLEIDSAPGQGARLRVTRPHSGNNHQ